MRLGLGMHIIYGKGSMQLELGLGKFAARATTREGCRLGLGKLRIPMERFGTEQKSSEPSTERKGSKPIERPKIDRKGS